MPIVPPQIVPADLDGQGIAKYTEPSFSGTGMDSFAAPTSTMQAFVLLQNVMPPATGALVKRWGYNLFKAVGFAPRQHVLYIDSAGVKKFFFTSTSTVSFCGEDGSALTGLFNPTLGASVPRALVSRGTIYFADGISADLLKYIQGVGGTSKWGIAAPVTAIGVGAPSAGAVTLKSGRKYYAVFQNSTTGHASDLSPISASTGALTAQQVPLSNIPTSADTQVDKVYILATADAGSTDILYELGNVNNGVTTFADNIPETTLLLRNRWHELDDQGIENGIANNVPPPNGLYPTKHNGRIFLIVGAQLAYSKNLAEVTTSTSLITSRYEESFPPDYIVDISAFAETPRGMLSVGGELYIGTNKHIRRLTGDGPDFGVPELAFEEAGILNQDVWQLVYQEGSPSGAMWVSNDGRIFKSDGYNYLDVGTSIQNYLDGMNKAAAPSVAKAVFYSNGVYDLYILGIPTGGNSECDTLLIYNLRTQRWVVWVPTNVATSLLSHVDSSGIPQLYMGSFDANVYNFNSTAADDHGVQVVATATTAWRDFGDASGRKRLNNLEVITEDSSLNVTVLGASGAAQFNSPRTVKTATVSGDPFGNLRVPLAGSITKDRYYKFTFASAAAPNTKILESLKVDIVPTNRL